MQMKDLVGSSANRFTFGRSNQHTGSSPLAEPSDRALWQQPSGRTLWQSPLCSRLHS